MANNPIPFNPATMRVVDLLKCAESLQTLFTMVERDRDDAAIAGAVRQARDYLLQQVAK